MGPHKRLFGQNADILVLNLSIYTGYLLNSISYGKALAKQTFKLMSLLLLAQVDTMLQDTSHTF